MEKNELLKTLGFSNEYLMKLDAYEKGNHQYSDFEHNDKFQCVQSFDSTTLIVNDNNYQTDFKIFTITQ